MNNTPSITMSYDITARNNALDAMCEISLNGYTTKKLDFLGTIHIYGVHYFNVFRRYNSVYEIVLEDFHGDFHFHKDYTIRQSLQHILCLSNEQMEGLYTRYATSFKHGSCPMTSMHDAPNMHWSELQQQWQAAALDFGGILEDYHQTPWYKNEAVDPILEGELEEASPSLDSPQALPPLQIQGTPCVLHAPLKIPYAPLQERTKPQQININLDSDTAEILLSLRKRGTNLSDRFTEMENKKRTWTQLSESESESESEEEEEEEEEEEQEEEQEDEEDEDEESEEEEKKKPSWCTVLRNGTTIMRY